jgi:hypothetical protein
MDVAEERRERHEREERETREKGERQSRLVGRGASRERAIVVGMDV